MKAIILAAGLGTRLKSMTNDRPKALVEVNGRSMIENLLLHLKSQGIHRFLINIHHFADQIIAHLESKEYLGLDISFSDESQRLLDTGGAIRKAIAFFKGNEDILIHNADVASGIDFKRLASFHKKKSALATLCVRKRNSGRALLFDNKMHLCGWTNIQQNEFKWIGEPTQNYNSFAYNGIYLVRPDFAEKIPFTGRFSIIDAWLEIAKTERIIGFEDTSDFWFDLGTQEKIKQAENYFNKKS